MPLLSLAHMSVLELTPPQLVACASAAGFSGVGLRLSPAREGEQQYPMIGDTPMMRETQALLRDSGVQVLDVEVIWLRPDTRATDYEGLFAAAARLGARRILVAGADANLARATASFAAVCELADRYGLGVDLEFMLFSEVKSLQQALSIVQGAQQTNGGVLLDALHVARSGTTLEDVARIDPALLRFCQLCDAPEQSPGSISELGHEARFDRLLPGEGGLPLAALFTALPRDLDVSVEIPLARERGRLGAAERATLLCNAARRFLAQQAA